MRSFLVQLKSYAGVLVLAFLLTSCLAGDAIKEATDPVEQQPVAGADEWLNNLIQQLRLEKAANPPAKIYRYTYNDQVVYYLSGRCCDVPSTLYDLNGKKICEPEGGITGKGDGRCADFFDKRTNETLIWEDKRE